MSRRFSSTQRSRVLFQSTPDNPYQYTSTSESLPHQKNAFVHHPTQYTKDNYNTKPTSVCPNGCSKSTCLSDEALTDTNTYYEYYPDTFYPQDPNKSPRSKEFVYSDDSGSVRLPHYEEISLKRHSRNAYSDRSLGKKVQQTSIKNGKVLNTVLVHKDVRRIYPNQDECDRLYHEVLDPRSSSESASNLPRRELPRSRLSDRPQSSQGSAVSSAIVDGCGGHCQTFENVCYYFLQVAFTMGILIGTSLCIAGAVLRKSAARNLQVLVYIGAMLSLVSALLLGVQCNARNTARKRRKALKNAKRAPIPMDVLSRGSNAGPIQQQPLVVVEEPNQRNLPNHGNVAYPHRSILVNPNPMVEEPGIPWWRLKDPNK